MHAQLTVIHMKNCHTFSTAKILSTLLHTFFSRTQNSLDSIATNLSLPIQSFSHIPPRHIMSDTEFTYINCLDREYNNQDAKISSVIFNISRYGEFRHTIDFAPQRVTESVAIRAVEVYLSQPLDESYYTPLQHDTFHRHAWQNAKLHFTCRGDVLGDSRYLEAVSVDESGQLSFFIGS